MSRVENIYLLGRYTEFVFVVAMNSFLHRTVIIVNMTVSSGALQLCYPVLMMTTSLFQGVWYSYKKISHETRRDWYL